MIQNGAAIRGRREEGDAHIPLFRAKSGGGVEITPLPPPLAYRTRMVRSRFSRQAADGVAVCRLESMYIAELAFLRRDFLFIAK